MAGTPVDPAGRAPGGPDPRAADSLMRAALLVEERMGDGIGAQDMADGPRRPPRKWSAARRA